MRTSRPLLPFSLVVAVAVASTGACHFDASGLTGASRDAGDDVAPLDLVDAAPPSGHADADAPAPEPLGAAVWLSTADGSKRLRRQPDVDLALGAPTRAALAIEVDTTTTYQRMDGFGAALTESSAWLLATRMDAGQRRVLLRRLFDRAGGIGLRLVRLPVGASDFALASYSYDDTPSSLDDFTIAHDRQWVVPVLHEIQAVSPEVRRLAAPWSPPGWMKTSGTMLGGRLQPGRRAALADYLVRFAQGYADEGLPIDVLTVQNEPRYEPTSYPSMRMEWEEQATFIRDFMGPALAASGLATRLFVWDQNWDEAWYAENVLGDDAARAFVAGTAFHCYAGDPSAQDAIHAAHPELGLWVTECSSRTITGAHTAQLRESALLLIGSTRHFASAVLKWNLALDENHGPQNGGCQDCLGTVRVARADGEVVLESEYDALGHLSRFVVPGAYRVASATRGVGSLEHVAFVNPDGTLVVVVFNAGAAAASFELESVHGALSLVLPAGALATYTLGERVLDLDASGFEASAWASEGGTSGAAAFDGDPTTRWASGVDQAPGQSFTIDLGEARRFSALTLDAGASPGDYPRGLRVEVSSAGMNGPWMDMASAAPDEALFTVRFQRVSARFVRLTQTGSASRWWSIHELRLHDE